MINNSFLIEEIMLAPRIIPGVFYFAIIYLDTAKK